MVKIVDGACLDFNLLQKLGPRGRGRVLMRRCRPYLCGEPGNFLLKFAQSRLALRHFRRMVGGQCTLRLKTVLQSNVVSPQSCYFTLQLLCLLLLLLALVDQQPKLSFGVLSIHTLQAEANDT